MTDTSILAIPGRVTVDRLPVISAVRYGTGINPVEYIAIVDCGEGTLNHPYATFTCMCGRARSKPVTGTTT
jgi:hypothetical protein